MDIQSQQRSVKGYLAPDDSLSIHFVAKGMRMAPRIETVYKLPDIAHNECPQSIAREDSQGRERILVGCLSVGRDSRVFRIDIAADTCETFPIPGVSNIVDVAAAEGGYYLVNGHNSIHRLDDQMRIVATTPEPNAAVLSIEGADSGFVAVLAHRNDSSIPASNKNKGHYSLVRYSDTLEKQWHVDFPPELVPEVRRPDFSPVVPLMARGAERFYVATSQEHVSLIEIRDPLEPLPVHHIPGLRQSYAGLFTYEGAYYERRPEYSEYIRKKRHRKKRQQVHYLPAFTDACSRPSDNAVILVDRTFVTADVAGERQRTDFYQERMATGFYDCRFDESISGFRTQFSILEGSFMWGIALTNNRIAALGRLTFGGDRVVAIIKLPDFHPVG
jgi:hypothetical protein